MERGKRKSPWGELELGVVIISLSEEALNELQGGEQSSHSYNQNKRILEGLV